MEGVNEDEGRYSNPTLSIPDHEGRFPERSIRAGVLMAPLRAHPVRILWVHAQQEVHPTLSTGSFLRHTLSFVYDAFPTQVLEPDVLESDDASSRRVDIDPLVWRVCRLAVEELKDPSASTDAAHDRRLVSKLQHIR